MGGYEEVNSAYCPRHNSHSASASDGLARGLISLSPSLIDAPSSFLVEHHVMIHGALLGQSPTGKQDPELRPVSTGRQAEMG